MKVAISASGRDLDAATDPRFGRCQYFVLVNTDDMSYQTVENVAATQGSGAGIAAAQLVANAGADAVIAANIGPNAFSALSAGGLKIYQCGAGTVRDAIEALMAGQLPETTGANVPSHSGMGGAGAGMAWLAEAVAWGRRRERSPPPATPKPRLRGRWSPWRPN